MPGVVQKAVEAMRAGLGLGALVDPVGDRHAFETEHGEVVVEAAPDGRSAIMRMRLGWLSADPRLAESEVRQLLRLGLALGLVNRAAAGILGAEEGMGRAPEPNRERIADLATGQGRPIAIGAWADCGAVGSGAIGALQDLLQWAEMTAGLLSRRSDAVAPATVAAVAVPTEEMMIFRP